MLRLVGHCSSAGAFLAALIAIAPAPALACSRSGSPDPIGWSTADFFGWKVVAAATTLDLALAEQSWPLPSLKSEQKPKATTFRVIQRIKGGSPDRFTLFTVDRNMWNPNPQPQFSVDGEGRVIPYEWLKEAPTQEAPPLSSCQAGYVSAQPGNLYFIARDTAGRLLGQIQIYEGERPMESFDFLPADLPGEGPWYDNLLYASTKQQRRPVHIDENGEEPVPDDSIATLTFKQPMNASDVARLLSSASATPFAVRVAAGSLIDETRMPVSQASESLIELAVIRARDNLTAESNVRIPAANALDRYKPFQFDNDGSIIRWGHALLAAENKLAAAKITGVQGIISVELAGTPATWTALRSDPRVARLLTGTRIAGRQFAPAVPVAEPVWGWEGLKGPELIAKLRELAKR